jgi:phosphohistidine phosphatase
MKLYLVQHGEALSDTVDPARPLSDAGREDVGKMAAFFAARPLSLDRIAHSGKLRARQTAEILSAVLAPGKPVEQCAGLSPNDPPDGFARELAGWSEDVMVVGHLPFLGRLAGLLVSGDPDGGLVAYRPGSVVCLEQGGENDWAVAWMLRPELLG